MAQHDYIISNQGFASYRSDHNSSLSAIVSNNSGATEPSTTYAYQWWYDETTDILKMRNSDNDAWITMFTFNQTADTYSLATDVELTITENLDLTGSATISGDLTVDTDTLYVDTTNNRVGVKNASPTVELDVTGEAKISGDLTVDTDTLYVDSTNNRVGIGTSSPSTAFVATTNANGRVIMLTHDTGLNEIRSTDSDQTTYVNLRYDATEHIFESEDTEIARFTSTGLAIGGTGTANTLDDYEEGTWTPEAAFSVAQPSAGNTTGTGSYTKVGNMVTVWGAVANINVTGASGDFRIRDLPFTSTGDATLVGYQGTAKLDNVNFATGYVTAEIPDGQSYVRFPENRDNLSTDFLRVSTCTDGSTDSYFTVTYKTN